MRRFARAKELLDTAREGQGLPDSSYIDLIWELRAEQSKKAQQERKERWQSEI